MRSGVAKAIRAKYPRAFEAYFEAFKRHGDALPMGLVQAVDCGKHTIINIVGQKSYGYDGGLYLSYVYLAKAFEVIGERLPGETIAMPLIGCGLAGGEWSKVSSIIESANIKPVVYVLNDEVKF